MSSVSPSSLKWKLLKGRNWHLCCSLMYPKYTREIPDTHTKHQIDACCMNALSFLHRTFMALQDLPASLFCRSWPTPCCFISQCFGPSWGTFQIAQALRTPWICHSVLNAQQSSLDPAVHSEYLRAGTWCLTDPLIQSLCLQPSVLHVPSFLLLEFFFSLRCIVLKFTMQGSKTKFSLCKWTPLTSLPRLVLKLMKK